MTSAEQQTYLAQNLRGLQAPLDSLWWPLAPGWWVVAGSFAILICIMIYRFLRNRPILNERLARTSTACELDECFENWKTDGDTEKYVYQVSYLLRQTAVRFSDRRIVASLNGKEWIQWMENEAGPRFSSRTRNLLEVGGYQRNPPAPDSQSHIEIKNWFARYMRSACTESASESHSNLPSSNSSTTPHARHA